MYSFQTKKALARKYARPADIPLYRQLLAQYRLPASGRIGFNQRQLSEELLYTLLDHFTIEEIQGRTAPQQDHVPEATKMVHVPMPAPEPVETVENFVVKPKISKAEQYPYIRWMDMDNPQIRTADSIFTDRINCFRRLHELEALTMGESAERDVLAEIVATSIRHEICFQELRAFNDHGEFLGKHPFISQKNEREQVLQMLRENPDSYFEARKNIELNISRYSSQINGKKANDKARERARENLETYQAKLALYKEVFTQFTSGK